MSECDKCGYPLDGTEASGIELLADKVELSGEYHQDVTMLDCELTLTMLRLSELKEAVAEFRGNPTTSNKFKMFELIDNCGE